METLLHGLRTNRAFAVTTFLLLLLVLIAVAAPALAPYDPTEAIMRNAYLPPSGEHLFGTDKLGRDAFSRVLFGARASLTGVLLLVGTVFVVGTTMGVISGYFGGVVDMVIMRISDMMISFPGMILAIAVAGIMGGSLVNAVIALTIVSWTKYARLARSMVLKIKRRDFVDAAIVNGGKPLHILWVHILPNILPMMVITAAADIGALMMELAGLSFLGFGSQPPAPEWGLMLNEGRQQLQTAPWLMIFPGLAIFVTVVIFNLWGDNLRDVLDPLQESNN
jgi:peptide/nickel transport system permease protein/nickel transport system permease protein